jgi:hypothetical protein
VARSGAFVSPGLHGSGGDLHNFLMGSGYDEMDRGYTSTAGLRRCPRHGSRDGIEREETTRSPLRPAGFGRGQGCREERKLPTPGRSSQRGGQWSYEEGFCKLTSPLKREALRLSENSLRSTGGSPDTIGRPTGRPVSLPSRGDHLSKRAFSRFYVPRRHEATQPWAPALEPRLAVREPFLSRGTSAFARRVVQRTMGAFLPTAAAGGFLRSPQRRLLR